MPLGGTVVGAMCVIFGGATGSCTTCFAAVLLQRRRARREPTLPPPSKERQTSEPTPCETPSLAVELRALLFRHMSGPGCRSPEELSRSLDVEVNRVVCWTCGVTAPSGSFDAPKVSERHGRAGDGKTLTLTQGEVKGFVGSMREEAKHEADYWGIGLATDDTWTVDCGSSSCSSSDSMFATKEGEPYSHDDPRLLKAELHPREKFRHHLLGPESLKMMALDDIPLVPRGRNRCEDGPVNILDRAADGLPRRDFQRSLTHGHQLDCSSDGAHSRSSTVAGLDGVQTPGQNRSAPQSGRRFSSRSINALASCD